MISPFIVIAAPAIMSLIMQYVIIPIVGHWIDLKRKGREWIFGWYVILLVGYVSVGAIWGSVSSAVDSAKEKARHAQVVREVEENYQRHNVTLPDGEIYYRE